MKKHLTALFLALMLAAVAAAQGGNFRIEGSFDNKKMDGNSLALLAFDGDEEMLSSPIKNGKFSIEGIVDQPKLMQIFVKVSEPDEEYYYSVDLIRKYGNYILGAIILEPGTIQLNIYGNVRSTLTIGGTPMNDRLQELYSQCMSDTIREDPENQKAFIYAMAAQNKRETKRFWDFYHNNEHNKLGAFALYHLLDHDPIWSSKHFADSILHTLEPELAQNIEWRLKYQTSNIFPGHSMLDFKGNAISKNAGTGTWSAPAPATLKQLQANRMSIIYFWGYEINNNVRDELVQLRSLLDSIGAKDINFIGVYSSEYELHKLPERLNSTGIDFPVFIDTDHQIATLYNSREHHHAFILVDPDGVILVSTLHSFFDNNTKKSLRAFLQ